MGRYPSLKLSIAQYRVDLDLFANYITYTVAYSYRPQVRNGLSLKYRVVCSRVWPHLGEFTNYTTLVIISLCLWVWVDIQVCKPLMLVYVARHWILGSSHSALLGRATFLLTEDLVQPTVSWPQVRNGLSLKYRVVCSRVWPHLGEFTNYTTLVIISLCHD